MNYELIIKLLKAGFKSTQMITLSNFISQDGEITSFLGKRNDGICIPTLSDLIQSIESNKIINLGESGKEIIDFTLVSKMSSWKAGYYNNSDYEPDWVESLPIGEGSTPEEAVANLWLELNKK